MALSQKNLAATVDKHIQSARVIDFHTHLFTPCHGSICWWGIDDLLTYHYLIAETFRYIDMPYDKFWGLSKTAQSDLVWKTLFVDRTPISEACRGVITCLNRLGLDNRVKDLKWLRRFYNGFTAGKFIDKIF
ncbi:MAG: glucuronate isomerase, partial [Fibrobacterota bacterium]